MVQGLITLTSRDGTSTCMIQKSSAILLLKLELIMDSFMAQSNFVDFLQQR